MTTALASSTPLPRARVDEPGSTGVIVAVSVATP
jgi:hypothetical protein